MNSKMGLLPVQAKEKQGLMTVVLDMDETLIHSDFVGCSEEEYKAHEVMHSIPPFDFFLTVCDGVAVYIRPGLAHFLKLLHQLFEVVIFTAGEKDYADAVLDAVDPEGYISHRLYRDSTCEYRGLNFVKDLTTIGRDLSKCVLLDNNLISMAATPDNCILIDDFFTDKSDRELPLVASILMDLTELEDVRPVLRDAFCIRDIVDQRIFSQMFDQFEDDDDEGDVYDVTDVTDATDEKEEVYPENENENENENGILTVQEVGCHDSEPTESNDSELHQLVNNFTSLRT